MATTFETAVVQEVPKRRPIERPIGWDGFKARHGIMVITIINFVIFFALWEIIARMGVVSKLLLPPISGVVTETIEMGESGELWKHMSFSAQNFTADQRQPPIRAIKTSISGVKPINISLSEVVLEKFSATWEAHEPQTGWSSEGSRKANKSADKAMF